MDLTARQATPDDHNFIYSTWLRGVQSSDLWREVPKDGFFKVWHRAVELVLKSGVVTIAHPHGDPDTIYGYLAAEGANQRIHHIYVKYPLRRFGVGTFLLKNHWLGKMPFEKDQLKQMYNNFIKEQDDGIDES